MTMTRKIMVVGLILVAGAAIARQTTLKTDKDKLSYSLGMDLGNQFRSMPLDVDPDLFYQGLKDALSGAKTLLTPEEAKAIITIRQKQFVQKQAEAAKALGERNKQDGDAFLAANKTKEGVVTLPSGLQYKILQAGTGKKPTADDTVVCQYRGTLINGTEFHSSYKRSQAATFPVKGVIKGWTEALQLMPVGSKWQLFVPSEMAYGVRGFGNAIAPNSVLVFEVELVSIQEKK